MMPHQRDATSRCDIAPARFRAGAAPSVESWFGAAVAPVVAAGSDSLAAPPVATSVAQDYSLPGPDGSSCPGSRQFAKANAAYRGPVTNDPTRTFPRITWLRKSTALPGTAVHTNS
jgi:hypothetical protein